MKTNFIIFLALLFTLTTSAGCKKKAEKTVAKTEEKVSKVSTKIATKTKNVSDDSADNVVAPVVSNTTAGMMTYLPADTEVVFVVDLSVLRESAVWKKMLSLLPAEVTDEIGVMEKKCGFNPILSLKRVTYAFNSAREEEPVVVVEGVERTAMVKCIVEMAKEKKKEVAVVDEGDFTLFTPKNDKEQMIAWVNNTMILVPQEANKAYLQARLEGKNSLQANADFQAKAAKVNQGASVWIAGFFGTASELGKKLTSGPVPKGFYGSLDLDVEITLKGGVIYSDEKAAENALRSHESDLQDFRTILALVTKTFKLSTDGADVKVEVSIGVKELEQLANLGKSILKNK